MLIVNADVFDGTVFRKEYCVRLKEGQIAETGAGLAPEAGEGCLDLDGDRLLPGFVDVHIHGCFGADAMRGEEDVRTMSRELYKLGVAAFCPTTMSAAPEDTRKALAGIRAVMDRPEVKGARVLGAHMEAPFLAESRAGAQDSRYFRDPDWAWVVETAAGRPGTVRFLTLAPERAGSEELIRLAVEAGIHVSVGHSAAEARTVHRAADWGADHVTHLFNAQSPLNHRAPGVPGAALTDDRLFCEMICDGVHLHPDVIQLVLRCKSAAKALAITDAMEAAGLPEGMYRLGGQDVWVRDGEARLGDGTLAGSVLTMPKALENLIGRFNIAPEEACTMCTVTPALSAGEETAGRIVPGAPGLLTRWGKDWKMKAVLDEDGEIA